MPSPLYNATNTPPKRRLKSAKAVPNKRRKIVVEEDEDDGGETCSSDSGWDTEDEVIIPVRTKRTKNVQPSTRWVLETFASGMMYPCHSQVEASFLSPPYACAFSNGSKAGTSSARLAIATEEGSVHIVDPSPQSIHTSQTLSASLVFQPHSNGIFDITFSPDDTLLATASGDQTIGLSSLEHGSVINVLRGHTASVKTIKWQPSNEAVLATAGRDGAIMVWDIRQRGGGDGNGGPVITLPSAHEEAPVPGKRAKPRKSKTSAVRSVTDLIWSPIHENTLYSSGTFDATIHAWDLRFPRSSKVAANPKRVYPSYSSSCPSNRGITSLSLGRGPSANILFALSTSSSVYAFDVGCDALHPIREYANPNAPSASFYIRLAPSPCGRWLACGASPHTSGEEGRMHLYDVANASRPWVHPQSEPPVQVKTGQKGEVGSIDWTSNGMIATCADDGTVRVWTSESAA